MRPITHHTVLVVFAFVLILLSALVFRALPLDREEGVRNEVTHNRNISGMVVPHHNLVAVQRAQLFARVAQQIPPPQTIILVSPNHYSAGAGTIQTTHKDWKILDGTISANQEVVAFLTHNKLATDEPQSFEDEHGIYNILVDIKQTFPSATLVPLILENVSTERLFALTEALSASCTDCLMIASVDFSHYQPALLGALHDDRSIRALEMLDTADLGTGAEVDSGSALALLTLWAKHQQTNHFTLWDHTNSGVLMHDLDAESTTHVFGWYEKGAQVVPQTSVSFLFGGDMLFARNINHAFKDDFTMAVSDLGDRLFWGTDAAVVNLEGAITSRYVPDDIRGDNVTFRFSPSSARALSYLHVGAVSQANNHSDNAGDEGASTTEAVLESRHIQIIGGPRAEDATHVAQFLGHGLRLSVIGINLIPGDQDAPSILPLIAQLKKDPTMRVIVMPHWGIEYATRHSALQATVAHQWIDAGADMVIGGHPHVVQDAEIYKGVPIIYSLGNFLFDQTFSQATQEGLLIGGKFTDTGVSFFALPTQSVAYRPRLLIGKRKAELLDRLYGPLKPYLVDTPEGSLIKIPKEAM